MTKAYPQEAAFNNRSRDFSSKSPSNRRFMTYLYINGINEQLGSQNYHEAILLYSY